MKENERNFYEPFEIIKFEKFSDDIIHVGRGLILRINVALAKSFNDNRYFFYKEYEYTLQGYKRVSIKRGFDYYISLEEVLKPKDRYKFFIRIGLSDFYILKQRIDEMIQWFTSNKYSKLFAKNNNEMVLGMTNVPRIGLQDLPSGVSLMFNPVVIGVGNSQMPGIAIELDNGKDAVDYTMTVDQLFALKTALDGFNPFISAQIMVASMGIPLGTNRVDLDDAANNHQLPALNEEEKVKKANTSIEGRLIGGVKKLEDL